MQDEIVSRLANQLQAELINAEAKRAERSTNPDSMDHYFQGLALFNRGATAEFLDKARSHFHRALDLDPDNVDALVNRAMIDLVFVANFLSNNRHDRFRSAETDLHKALKLRPENANAHLALGALRMWGNRAEESIAEYERALAIDRNLALAHAWIGAAKYFAGRFEETEAHILEALRISPRDIWASVWAYFAGIAKLGLGRDEEAVAWLNRSIELNPNWPLSHLLLAAAMALLGRLEKSRDAVRAGLELNPTFTIARMRSQTFSDNPTYLASRERLYEGMRLAGVPEGEINTN